MSPILAVLRFRRVEDPERGRARSPHAVPGPVFARALAWLLRNDWTVIDAERLVRGLDEPDALPGRSALITIDGPYRSLLKDALPTLRAHALPAVLFVPVHFIGRDAALEPSTPPASVCTLNDLRYLESQGVSIQSMGVTGRTFDALSESEREWEAMRSRQALEAALDGPIELFAFPRGDPGPQPTATGRMIQRCGYRAAFACRGSANRLDEADRFRLARVTVGPATDLAIALGERATRLA